MSESSSTPGNLVDGVPPQYISRTADASTLAARRMRVKRAPRDNLPPPPAAAALLMTPVQPRTVDLVPTTLDLPQFSASGEVYFDDTARMAHMLQNKKMLEELTPTNYPAAFEVMSKAPVAGTPFTNQVATHLPIYSSQDAETTCFVQNGSNQNLGRPPATNHLDMNPVIPLFNPFAVSNFKGFAGIQPAMDPHQQQQSISLNEPQPSSPPRQLIVEGLGQDNRPKTQVNEGVDDDSALLTNDIDMVIELTANEQRHYDEYEDEAAAFDSTDFVMPNLSISDQPVPDQLSFEQNSLNNSSHDSTSSPNTTSFALPLVYHSSALANVLKTNEDFFNMNGSRDMIDPSLSTNVFVAQSHAVQQDEAPQPFLTNVMKDVQRVEPNIFKLPEPASARRKGERREAQKQHDASKQRSSKATDALVSQYPLTEQSVFTFSSPVESAIPTSIVQSFEPTLENGVIGETGDNGTEQSTGPVDEPIPDSTSNIGTIGDVGNNGITVQNDDASSSQTYSHHGTDYRQVSDGFESDEDEGPSENSLHLVAENEPACPCSASPLEDQLNLIKETLSKMELSPVAATQAVPAEYGVDNSLPEVEQATVIGTMGLVRGKTSVEEAIGLTITSIDITKSTLDTRKMVVTRDNDIEVQYDTSSPQNLPYGQPSKGSTATVNSPVESSQDDFVFHKEEPETIEKEEVVPKYRAWRPEAEANRIIARSNHVQQKRISNEDESSNRREAVIDFLFAYNAKLLGQVQVGDRATRVELENSRQEHIITYLQNPEAAFVGLMEQRDEVFQQNIQQRKEIEKLTDQLNEAKKLAKQQTYNLEKQRSETKEVEEKLRILRRQSVRAKTAAAADLNEVKEEHRKAIEKKDLANTQLNDKFRCSQEQVEALKTEKNVVEEGAKKSMKEARETHVLEMKTKDEVAKAEATKARVKHAETINVAKKSAKDLLESFRFEKASLKDQADRARRQNSQVREAAAKSAEVLLNSMEKFLDQKVEKEREVFRCEKEMMAAEIDELKHEVEAMRDEILARKRKRGGKAMREKKNGEAAKKPATSDTVDADSDSGEGASLADTAPVPVTSESIKEIMHDTEEEISTRFLPLAGFGDLVLRAVAESVPTEGVESSIRAETENRESMGAAVGMAEDQSQKRREDSKFSNTATDMEDETISNLVPDVVVAPTNLTTASEVGTPFRKTSLVFHAILVLCIFAMLVLLVLKGMPFFKPEQPVGQEQPPPQVPQHTSIAVWKPFDYGPQPLGIPNTANAADGFWTMFVITVWNMGMGGLMAL